MNHEYKDISEYLVVLEKYIWSSKSKEIIDKIGSGFFNKDNSKSISDKLYSESFRLRSFIDRVVTYTQSSISPKKHLNLMLALSDLTLGQGELFLASDILSQVLFRTIKHKNLQNEKAFAFMGMGEISSMQAKWDESFGYVNKAKKIATGSSIIQKLMMLITSGVIVSPAPFMDWIITIPKA